MTVKEEPVLGSLPPAELLFVAPGTDTAKYVLPTWRKYTILFVISWMALVITWSTSSLFVATDEISAQFHTTPTVLNIMNACMLLLMGVSSLIWVPLGRIWGRERVYTAAIVTLLATSIGMALAPNMAVFTLMRLLGGVPGTYFMVAGQTILADIFEPTTRGRANGFFMTGSVSGPAAGACVSGVIITFTHWRVIYWVQVGMTCLGLVLSVLFVRGLSNKKDRLVEFVTPGGSFWLRFVEIATVFDPRGTFKQFLVLKIFLAHVVCGFLAVTQYGLLASVRYVINPRFHLSTPLVSGLFYIAPGVGFVCGSIVGGQLSDRTVKRYITKRNGVRIPKDRLNSGLIGLLAILPASLLIFGWTLQKEVGGLALLIVSAFWVGVGLMGTFNGLNTYAAEVSPSHKSEVIGAKYIMQYLFAAASTASVIPLIHAIGAGAAFTIFVGLDIIGGAFVIFITRYMPEGDSKS